MVKSLFTNTCIISTTIALTCLFLSKIFKMIAFNYTTNSTNLSFATLVQKASVAPTSLPTEFHAFFHAFKEGTELLEFLKIGAAYHFFIKEDQSSEALRVAGSSLLAQLNKTTDAIVLEGSDSASLLVAEGIALAGYQFLPYFSDKAKKEIGLKEVILPTSVVQEKMDELTNTVKAVCWARDRVNEPVSHLNAVQLSEKMSELCTSVGCHVQVLEKTQIESLKMGGLLAVNKGSIDPPTFTIIEYKPSNAKNTQPIVLVGKGVVYDTGGLSLKPTPGSMDCMKSDMGGAACMAATIYLAAAQKLPVHLIGLIPATDNRPGLNAYAPGDVITMYDGTSVEVLNTDAEGRMILADALAYSNKYNPALVIDAATLTGAALRAIGTKASVIMGNASDDNFSQLEAAGNEVHERVVRFPFWDDYAKEIKSSIADLKNLGGPNAGMITAGKFLEHFVKSPYIHMDIAGPAWLDAKEDYRTQGGTGAGVRLLYTFLKNY
jgi:leucyl aminopeptidase